MSRKSKNLILLAALIAAALAVCVTAANSVVKTRTRNIITTGEVDISITETSPVIDDAAVSSDVNLQCGFDFNNILPGAVISQQVNIKNDADKCWLRVKLQKTAELLQGKEVPSGFQSQITINCNEDYWRLADDGYYYYKVPLEENAVAIPLFDEVHFSTDMGNEYIGARVTLTVIAEAVQYKNNESGLLGWVGDN